ncbi:MAG: transposase [Halothece sp. Uz-M2-17]|nr:transposase [Halothece sp. Uz-M2-17]
MPEYRRFYQAGGTFFLTLVTYNRYPYFSSSDHISLLRQAIRTVKQEMPFDILGAVILPDHLHFLWQLPPSDSAYSKRVGRLKVLFTRALTVGQNEVMESISKSRQKHRESNVWQRRFWEHTVRDEQDFEECLNYIHFNPIKHGLVSCPHFWSYSSFHSWVKQGSYPLDWCCVCGGRKAKVPDFGVIPKTWGE